MNPNLLWETITYSPVILFSIEPTQKGLRKSICHDISRFHYFLESQFGYSNVRGSDFTYCKSLLKTEILEADPGLLFYMTENFRDRRGFKPQLR